MKIEKDKFITLTPDEGYLLVNYNTKDVSSEICVGVNADTSEWMDVIFKEAESLQKQWDGKDFSGATEADYQEALEEMGVKLNG